MSSRSNDEHQGDLSAGQGDHIFRKLYDVVDSGLSTLTKRRIFSLFNIYIWLFKKNVYTQSTENITRENAREECYEECDASY